MPREKKKTLPTMKEKRKRQLQGHEKEQSLTILFQKNATYLAVNVAKNISALTFSILIRLT